jgi:heme/copper-type cytochrome/quinol oxidase subunit 2
MSRRPVLVIAVVVVAVLAVAGVFIVRSLSAGGADVTIDLTVTGTAMSPPNPTVNKGDRVTMSVTADKKEEIHLHVYDIKFDVEPGKKVTKSFTADKSGEFPIEIEDTSKELGSLTVKG